MNFKILDVEYDKVIRSKNIMVKIDAEYAIKVLVPLIDKYDMQRTKLKHSLYAKLKKDLENGCIIPPLTVAINSSSVNEKNIDKNMYKAFILDGIQRLNTLSQIGLDSIDKNLPIYINILICESIDRLLYRMITLNNGQKPMSARHQVEILTSNIFDFEQINLPIQSEKDSKTKRKIGTFKKDVIVKSYLAFISQTINIDNQKIIEEKLDELITDKIIESNIPNKDNEFVQIMDLIDIFIKNPELKKWFKVDNNIIAFCAGINDSINYIKDISAEDFLSQINRFEVFFKTVNTSKINLGATRRKLVLFLIKNFESLSLKSDLNFDDTILAELN